jgi:hypothetical protein
VYVCGCVVWQGPGGMKKRQDEYLNKVKRLEAEDRKRRAVAQSAWGLGSFIGMGGLGGSPAIAPGSYDEGEVVDGRPRDERGPPQRQLVRREREANTNTAYEGYWSDATQNDNQEGCVPRRRRRRQPCYEGSRGGAGQVAAVCTCAAAATVLTAHPHTPDHPPG